MTFVDNLLRNLGIGGRRRPHPMMAALTELKARIDAQDQRIDSQDETIAALQQAVDDRFEEMAREYETLRGRFAGHKSKTESELIALSTEIGMITRMLENERVMATDSKRMALISGMIRALKAKQTRANNARSAIVGGADVSYSLAVNDE